MGVVGAWVAPCVVAALTGCLSSDTSRQVGARCEENAECGAGLTCQYGRCRSVCTFDRDCPDGGACVAVAGDPNSRVCLLPDDPEGADFPGLVWSEGRFWNPCDPDVEGDCGMGRTCDPSTGLCAESPADGGDGDVDGDVDADTSTDIDADSNTDMDASFTGFRAFNDAVHGPGTSAPNVTTYSGYLGGGGGFETPSGLLIDFDTGMLTLVRVTLTAVNVAGSVGAMPRSGTPAHELFGGIVDLSWSASYNSSGSDWSYEVSFTDLDPSRSYTFVTTANRDDVTYEGDGNSSRWSVFTIVGADTFSNGSSAGVVEINAGQLRMNTGYNTESGDVIRWTGITAADGAFSVVSSNVGDAGPGDAVRSYGIQGFMLAEE